MLIRDLLRDDWNEAHIARHHVAPEEVEDICLFYPISARQMTQAERRRYQEHLGR